MPDESQSAPAAAVIAAIREAVGPNAAPIERSQSLADDISLDSLEFVAMIQAIEDRLSIRLDEQQAASASTVGDLVDLVERTCAAKGGKP